MPACDAFKTRTRRSPLDARPIQGLLVWRPSIRLASSRHITIDSVIGASALAGPDRRGRALPSENGIETDRRSLCLAATTAWWSQAKVRPSAAATSAHRRAKVESAAAAVPRPIAAVSETWSKPDALKHPSVRARSAPGGRKVSVQGRVLSVTSTSSNQGHCSRQAAHMGYFDTSNILTGIAHVAPDHDVHIALVAAGMQS